MGVEVGVLAVAHQLLGTERETQARDRENERVRVGTANNWRAAVTQHTLPKGQRFSKILIDYFHFIIEW